jgi:hypothetical protein
MASTTQIKQFAFKLSQKRGAKKRGADPSFLSYVFFVHNAEFTKSPMLLSGFQTSFFHFGSTLFGST